MSQLAFSLRSRRRHPHAIASITICGDPDGLGFLRVAPVSLSVTNRLVDRRQFGSLVRSLARPLPVVVHSLVQSPARSRARSLPPFSSLFRIPINNTHFVSSFRKFSHFSNFYSTLFSILVTRFLPPSLSLSLSVIESSSLIGRAGKSSGRVTKIASCSSIYRVCADIVGEYSLSFVPSRRER